MHGYPADFQKGWAFKSAAYRFGFVPPQRLWAICVGEETRVSKGRDKASGTDFWKEWTRRWPEETRSIAEMAEAKHFTRFIEKFSEVAAPLTDITKKSKGLEKWRDHGFESLKKSVNFASILVSPDLQKTFRGHIDASQLAVGGILTEPDEDGRYRVIAYFSKRLRAAERDYIANDRELLGFIFFLKRFRCYFESTSFEIRFFQVEL